MIPTALSIAGSDSGGGAGIQADLKTFSALGVYGATVLTSITAQNTQGVQAVEVLPGEFVETQLTSVLDDIEFGAIKTGMLPNVDIITHIADKLANYEHIPLVVDPVMVATSGDPLIDDEAVEVLIARLFPRATIITPNMSEAARLLNTKIAESDSELVTQCEDLLKLGPQTVMIKGGHGSGTEAVDYVMNREQLTRLTKPRLETKNTHGTGCTLSAAIAAFLSRDVPIMQAAKQAKTYLHRALSRADHLNIGHGHGPVHHFCDYWDHS